MADNCTVAVVSRAVIGEVLVSRSEVTKLRDQSLNVEARRTYGCRHDPFFNFKSERRAGRSAGCRAPLGKFVKAFCVGNLPDDSRPVALSRTVTTVLPVSSIDTELQVASIGLEIGLDLPRHGPHGLLSDVGAAGAGRALNRMHRSRRLFGDRVLRNGGRRRRGYRRRLLGQSSDELSHSLPHTISRGAATGRSAEQSSPARPSPYPPAAGSGRGSCSPFPPRSPYPGCGCAKPRGSRTQTASC